MSYDRSSREHNTVDLNCMPYEKCGEPCERALEDGKKCGQACRLPKLKGHKHDCYECYFVKDTAAGGSTDDKGGKAGNAASGSES